MIWYKQNKRSLPWRDTTDPYKIWLSEIILQQTRVEQGLPYYKKFIKAFKNLQSLANAETQQIMRLWQGLGYYTRARNLHLCAQTIVKDYNGTFPDSYDQLLKLPGIGKYTAAAIASFAFKEKVPVVDGNVIRVLSRLYGIEDDISTPKAQRIVYDLATVLISDDRPDLFNQAIMEFGAVQCIPKNPTCEKCIFLDSCYAYLHHKVNIIPLKFKKISKRIRYFNYLVIENRGTYLFKVRNRKDIWHGLFEFPLIESEQLLTPDQFKLYLPDWLKSAILVDESRLFKHILTHQEIFTVFYTFALNSATVPNTDDQFRFYDKKEIEQLPKPILIERFLKEKII